jgi:hypothetical protein
VPGGFVIVADPVREEGGQVLRVTWLKLVEAAGTAPASAEHPPDACYERSRGV